MRYYFAPLEGITDSVFRHLHHQFYPGLDRYYTPFLSPTIHRGLTQKERKEIPPADSLDFITIPQILTKNADDFIWLAQQCQDLGYQEVNLNLGCPSGTVTAKGKGSGMLRDLEFLDSFLDMIFTGVNIPISVKTRIGFSAPDEFPQILEIYNRYPISELIVHPRVRSAFYNYAVNTEIFAYAVTNSRNPVCYNGDITNIAQIMALPPVSAVMIGRGLIAYPGMLNHDHSSETLHRFLDALLEEYTRTFNSSRNAMFRLKEHWHYLQGNFPGSDKLTKQLRKSTDVDTFYRITDQIFAEFPFCPG